MFYKIQISQLKCVEVPNQKLLGNVQNMRECAEMFSVVEVSDLVELGRKKPSINNNGAGQCCDGRASSLVSSLSWTLPSVTLNHLYFPKQSPISLHVEFFIILASAVVTHFLCEPSPGHPGRARFCPVVPQHIFTGCILIYLHFSKMYLTRQQILQAIDFIPSAPRSGPSK